MHAFRWAPPSGADRRSAFPALCAALPTGVRAETGTTPRAGDARLSLAPRSGADRRSAFPALGAALPAGVRAETGTTPRAGDARLPLGSAQRCRPEVGVPCPGRRPAHGRTGRDGNHSTGWRCTPPAGLRPAVPTGGRRSLPWAPPCPRGDAPRREPLHGLAMHASRWAPPSGADRRSAFPALGAALPAGVRAETGTTPRAGWTPLRGPVDRACRCEHRRSLACAPLRHLGAALYRERFFLYSSVRRTGVPAKP